MIAESSRAHAMQAKSTSRITDAIGDFPYRLQLAGGWIDQPFVSRLNPDPPGSMVVVSLQPTFRFMDRAGMATGSRQIALRLWRGRLPDRPPQELAPRHHPKARQRKATWKRPIDVRKKDGE